MELRDYQIRTLDKLWDALQVKTSVLLTAPCSSGKTILFSKIIQRLLRENPSFRTLILVDREILVEQSRDKLRLVAPELADDIGIVCASVSRKKQVDCRVTIASRQSLTNVLDQFPPVQLIICDEAHLLAIPHHDDLTPGQYGKIIAILQRYNEHVRLIGCTASPYRLGSKGGYIYGDRNRIDAAPYFDKVDAEITTRELVVGRYISPLTGLAAVNDKYAEDLAHVNLVAGEYNLDQISDMMCKPVHIQSCVDSWLRYAGDRKKTLVFCTSIEHSERVARAFNDHGISSCAIHSKLSPIEEKAAMECLKQGTMAVFTSVAKLTTGMDISDIDTIIMARPTKSTALYQQCIGRGQRLAEGKRNCLVIDLTGCTTDFGTDMDNLHVAVPSSPGDGEAPTKICPGENEDQSICGKSVHASLLYCPYCLYKFPVTPEVEAAIGTMKKVEFNKIPEPEPYDVTYVFYEVHLSRKTKKELIKVTYECGIFDKVYEWICLPDYYSGYAVTKAKEWWEQRTDEPFPDSCDEFMFLSDELIKPFRIMVLKQPKQMDKVIDSWFVEYEDMTEEEFYDEVFDDGCIDDGISIDVPF